MKKTSLFKLACLLASVIANAGLSVCAIAQAADTGTSRTTVIESNVGEGRTGAGASGDQGVSSLITRQGRRLVILEGDIRDLRNVLDTDLRELKIQVGQLGEAAVSDGSVLSSEIRAIRDQMERLSDAVSLAGRRIERTLEIMSDMEFRLLRTEKRIDALLSGSNLRTIQPGIVENQGLLDAPTSGSGAISLGGSGENLLVQGGGAGVSGSVASLESLALSDQNALASSQTGAGGQLNASGGNASQLESSILGQQDGLSAGQEENGALALAGSLAGSLDAPQAGGALQPQEGFSPSAESVQRITLEDADTEVESTVLPEGTAEERFKFAIEHAVRRQYVIAETALNDFRRLHKGHSREVDAVYWLGRVQFLMEKYDLAAITFTEFSKDYPEDGRVDETTLWIAEAVAKFAAPDQQCAIFDSLPDLLEEPSEQFTQRLAELSLAAECG